MKKLLLTLFMLLLSASFLPLDSTTTPNPTGIKGNVHDENGEPVILASVVINPTIATTTNLSGDFILYCPPKVSHRLIISCVGFVPDTLTVPVVSGIMTEVSVTLLKDSGNE